MDYQSTLRAFQKVLVTHQFQPVSTSFSEDFAVKRFLKKFQEPDDAKTSLLVQKCWDDWIDFDGQLPEIGLLPREWYLVRDLLHKEIRAPKSWAGDFRFPKGSEFRPTRGQNSVEARLVRSSWTCTYENFESFATLVYGHAALKRAFRHRYLRWFRRSNFDLTLKQADRLLYQRCCDVGGKAGVAFQVFQWKLEQVTCFTQGSRFSSVPKNNEKRRPINVEPFGNTLTQSFVGEFLRSEMKRVFATDLDQLQDVHRKRISVLSDATIDLKNASDSISLDLVRFLLPDRLFRFIEKSRSPMILGPDKQYHVVKKVSSMGNGFTFELMTLILTALCRVLDSKASVFGDDIIIAADKAPRLIELLTVVGFVVNEEKSFITGPFRESCGANYHEVEGYVESYDFHWPTSIGDCVTVWNKLVRLAKLYPQFAVLRNRLARILPEALHGGPDPIFEKRNILELIGTDRDQRTLNFPLFFCTRMPKQRKRCTPNLLETLAGYQLDTRDNFLVPGFEFKSEEVSPCLKHLDARRNWAKYLMYLSAGRRARDVLTGEGEWKTVWFVRSGLRSFRASTLKNVVDCDKKHAEYNKLPF